MHLYGGLTHMGGIGLSGPLESRREEQLRLMP